MLYRIFLAGLLCCFSFVLKGQGFIGDVTPQEVLTSGTAAVLQQRMTAMQQAYGYDVGIIFEKEHIKVKRKDTFGPEHLAPLEEETRNAAEKALKKSGIPPSESLAEDSEQCDTRVSF